VVRTERHVSGFSKLQFCGRGASGCSNITAPYYIIYHGAAGSVLIKKLCSPDRRRYNCHNNFPSSPSSPLHEFRLNTAFSWYTDETQVWFHNKWLFSFVLKILSILFPSVSVPSYIFSLIFLFWEQIKQNLWNCPVSFGFALCLPFIVLYLLSLSFVVSSFIYSLFSFVPFACHIYLFYSFVICHISFSHSNSFIWNLYEIYELACPVHWDHWSVTFRYISQGRASDVAHDNNMDKNIFLSLSSYTAVSTFEFLSILTSYRVFRTPWTSDQPVTSLLPTDRTTRTRNKNTDIHASGGIRTHDSTVIAGFRLRGQCDRLGRSIPHRITGVSTFFIV
jgi:hypothetical protein